MNGIVNFDAFLIATIFLVLTPGNGTIFILSKSIAQGKNAGIVSVLGVGIGGLLHTFLAAFGLSLIVAKSIFLFSIIKYAGAAYLVYLGIRMLIENPQLQTEQTDADSQIKSWKLLRDGVLTRIFDPTVGLFFIAFLPQFVDANQTNTVFPFLILGTIFISMGVIWGLVLALFSSAIFGKLKSNQTFSSYLNKICGLALIGLGLKVALTGKR